MVWRGGINEFQVPVFPALVRAALVLRVEADTEEARVLHAIRLRIVYGGGEPAWQEIPAAFKDPIPPLPVSYLNLLVNIGVGVDRPGEGSVQLSVDGELIAPHLLFSVRRVPMPPGLFEPR